MFCLCFQSSRASRARKRDRREEQDKKEALEEEERAAEKEAEVQKEKTALEIDQLLLMNDVKKVKFQDEDSQLP